ncbi:MAG: hypothetical protein HXX08_17840 [Chloroflexi bacterium]|uniref:Uncharacterized protein n=1 Tax=Candidatus Chlorohelix allophototropha TaxID=3003348 RepID=A0A8T7M6H5_9CHLR|nr:hypothetical protein [Chloroflexota bacterium]WJW69624.1 hypothetical protein OZ401_003251 [Chloroflexota bacterium L227-S17]
MLNNNYGDLITGQAMEDIDRLLNSLRDSDPPVPRARTMAYVRSFSRPNRSAARFSFSGLGMGLRLGIPIGAAATIALLILALNVVTGTPIAPVQFDTALTALPVAPASVTLANQSQSIAAPEHMDKLHMNLVATASTRLVNYPSPVLTPAGVNNNP